MAAVNALRKEGIKAGLLRPITLWPFPTKKIAQLANKCKAMLCAEMSLGQMITDVKLAVNGKIPVHLYAKPGAFFPVAEDIETAVKSILNGKKDFLFNLEELAEKADNTCHKPENKICKEGTLL